MKIAVQIFGHLRTYKQCIQSLKINLLDLYDCDVFIHTWDKIDHQTKSWHNFHIEDTKQSISDLKEIITKLYSPKSLKIETQQVKDEGNVVAQDKEISLFGLKSMIYSMSEANRLREEYQAKYKIKYDYVLMIRPDIQLKKTFDIHSFVNEENEDCFYTAGFYKFKNLLNDFRYIGASDVLFFSTPEVISKIFNHKELLIEQIKQGKTTKYGPEYSIIYAIENMDIKPILLNYLESEDFKILRAGAESQGNIKIKKNKKTYKKILNKILRIHIKRNIFRIILLSGIKFQILNLKFNLGEQYIIQFIIGPREND